MNADELGAKWAQLEAALRASEQSFHLLTNVLPAMVFRSDANGNSRYVNDDRWQDLTGLPAGSWAGEGWLMAIYRPDRAKTLRSWQAAVAAQTFWQAEFRFQRQDGRLVWVLAQAAPVTDEHGRITGYLGACIDITAQKQIEIQLRESEERHRVLVEKSPLAIAVHSDEKVVYVNPEAVRLLGAPDANALLGQPIWRFVHRQSQPQVEQRVSRIYNKEGVAELAEEKFIRLDGQVIDVVAVGTPVDYLGKPSSQVVFYDITQRKQAELALRESEERLRRIIEHSVDGMMLTDEQACVIEWNQGMEVITGYQKAEMLGKPLWQIVYDLTPPALQTETLRHTWQTAVDTFLETGAGTWVNQLQERNLQHADGSTRVVQVLTFPIPGETGFMSGSIFRDVTEKVEKDRQIQQQERMAAVGQLAAGIAHDFNNILAVITLYTDILLRAHALPENFQDPVKIISQQAARAAELIEQILDFSRQTILAKKQVDLRPLLAELGQLWQRTLPANIQLEIIHAGESAMIQADAARIQQMFMNLVVNARDAMAEGGVLTIRWQIIPATRHPFLLSLASESTWLLITVSDTGTGITPEVQARLFEPFFTTKEPGKGTGLGLAQVYGIVRQHNGHIEVHSQLQAGTTFTIYLPAATAVPPPLPAAVISAFPQGEGITILLVEDDAVVREAIVNGLQALHYTVLVAGDGREGLDLYHARRDSINLILCDVVMPHLSGLQLAEILHAENNNVPLVLITGYPLHFDPASLAAQGITDWVLKPLSLQDLALVLAKTLPQ